MNPKKIILSVCVVVVLTASPATAKKPEPRICKKWGTKAFFEHAGAGPKEIRACVAAGRKVDKQDSQGRTMLHHAASLPGKKASTIALLQAGANQNSTDRIGRTPLHIASRAANVSAMSLLLYVKADPNVKDGIGKTPLRLLVDGYMTQRVIKYKNMTIREEAAYLKSQKINSQAPEKLLGAMSNDYVETAQLLFDMGADRNLRDSNGESPCEYLRNRQIGWMKKKFPKNVPSVLPPEHNYRRYETPWWPRAQFSFLVIGDDGWPDGTLMKKICGQGYHEWKSRGFGRGLFGPTFGIKGDES